MVFKIIVAKRHLNFAFFILNFELERVSSVARYERVVGKRSICSEAFSVSLSGANRSENVGMSNRNTG